MPWFQRLIGFSMMIVATACSSGSGGGQDDTPPEVVSVTPVDDATGVALDTVVGATFSEAMDPASVNTGSFRLKDEDGSAVVGAVTYYDGSKTATFTPSTPLRTGIIYRATLTLGVRDLAGNPLAAEVEWSFETVSEQQGIETIGGRVSDQGEVARDPTLIMAGDTLAVGYWVDPGVIAVNLWDGATWGDPLADPAAGQGLESFFRSVDGCAAGPAVHIVFSLLGDPEATDGSAFERVFVHRWTSATGWLTLNDGQEVSWPAATIDAGSSALEPAIACRAGQGPLVAWAEEPDGGPEAISALFVASVTEGSVTRSEPHNRVTHPGPVYNGAILTLDIAADDAGHAVVAFWEYRADESGCDLYVSEYDGATFSPLGDSLAFDVYPEFASVPSVAADGDTVYVAYIAQAEIGGPRQLWVKKYADGAWSTVGPADVSGDASMQNGITNPDLLVANGVPVLAWEEIARVEGNPDVTNEGIFIAHHASGSWVLDGRQIEVDPADPAFDPSLAFADGVLYVTFEEITGGTTGIYVRRTTLSF